MALRDVILRALLDWRLTAPLYLQAAIGPHELGLLADVAARAVEGQEPVGTQAEAQACGRRSGLGEVG